MSLEIKIIMKTDKVHIFEKRQRRIKFGDNIFLQIVPFT